MKEIVVGDWALVETYRMTFFAGELVYVDEFVVVVKVDKFKITIERIANVCFVGTKEQTVALETEVGVMMKAREMAMNAAEDRRSKIAADHAMNVRALLKQKQKELQ